MDGHGEGVLIKTESHTCGPLSSSSQRIAEVLVGDETGVVVLRARDGAYIPRQPNPDPNQIPLNSIQSPWMAYIRTNTKEQVAFLVPRVGDAVVLRNAGVAMYKGACACVKRHGTARGSHT